jgi:CheY-like chemotaxis protein
MKRKILLVDDDELILESTKYYLETKNYEVLVARNGAIALEIFHTQPVLLVITDLKMPVMDGISLVQSLLVFENKPIIIIQSAGSDMHLIIELMQKGVYDYLLKPLNYPELNIRVDNAYEAAELRIIKANLEKEKEVRISHMLNWNEWKEGIIKRDQDKVDGNLIGSIRTSFSQGSGLGALLSVIGRIQKKATEKEDCFEVSKSLMNFLFENAINAKRVINVLEEIDSIQSSEMPLELCTISEIHELLATISNQLQDYEIVKKQKISLCENQYNHYPHKIGINRKYFEKVISELLYNSFKFSKPDCKIYILLEIKPDKLFISILNTPEPDSSGVCGILPEYANIVFEPFFRISKLVFEAIPSLDFGLGLTMVDKIVRKHRGKIKAFNLVSHLDLEKSEKLGTLVNFEMEFPMNEKL